MPFAECQQLAARHGTCAVHQNRTQDVLNGPHAGGAAPRLRGRRLRGGAASWTAAAPSALLQGCPPAWPSKLRLLLEAPLHNQAAWRLL
jgi:hypothetical protein